jgi:hypothetical protein
MLRVSGLKFDVDSFTATCNLEIDSVFRRGEPIIRSKPTGQAYERSGLRIVVSNAGVHDLPSQQRDAIEFLSAHANEVRGLAAFSGVEFIGLDFGIARRDVAAQSDTFSVELIRLAGECRIALSLTQYTVSSEQ